VRIELNHEESVMSRTTISPTALVVLGIASGGLLAGCGGGDAGQGTAIATISSLSPDCAPRGVQSLNPLVDGHSAVILVTGQNLEANSVVRWNGEDLPTSTRGRDQLVAQVSANDIGAIGAATVTVFSPATGRTSNALTFTITSGGVSPQSIAVDPFGRFVYVVNEGCGSSAFGNVSMYSIDPGTGRLTPVGPPLATGDKGGKSVAITPDGKFAYVANWGDGDLWGGSIGSFAVNTTNGSLELLSLTDLPGQGPWSVSVDPSGKLLYAALEGGYPPTSVLVYAIDSATGALSFAGTFSASDRAIAVTVDPSGKFVYALNEAGSVSMYSASTAGILTPTGTVKTGASPTAIAVTPSGKLAYVTNGDSNDVSVFAIDPGTGKLTSLGTAAAGSLPVAIAIAASGKFAYVSNSASNNVSVYAIDPSSGALTGIDTTTAGLSPVAIVVAPSGRFVYVTNSGSNDVSMYGIDSLTGRLTPIGSVST
jgi:6-phosphogluconolactonase